jgi:exodeoxyribonuclease-5
VNIEVSKDQRRALDALLAWQKKYPSQYITLGGYAGTGKTTLIAILRKKLHKDKPKLKVAFCSYTGKAARVLKGKLTQQKALYTRDTVSTIHSLIYSPIENERAEIVGWERKSSVDCDLIIVDEASMIDEEIWKDLLWFNVPIIAVGDHGQLPPIRGNFNLMKKPKLRLEEIHRQAKENPIIRLSMIARERGAVPVGEYGKGVKKLKRSNPIAGDEVDDLLAGYDPETLILCGYNNTRVKLNTFVRGKLGFLDDIETQAIPQVGDRLICLRNNHEKQIFNGMHGKLRWTTRIILTRS